MDARIPTRLLAGARAVMGAALALSLMAGAASAETPAAKAAPKKTASAAAASGAQKMGQASSAFDSFTATWMTQLQAASALQPVAAGAVASRTYRKYTGEFTKEVKPTGVPSNPFVGVLKYVEEEYSCTDAARTQCSLVSTMPVTEIFRFQNGRWVY